MNNQIHLRQDIIREDTRTALNERLRITHTIPAILSESRYHTVEELEKAGYHFMKGGEKHQFEAHHTDKPPTRFTSHLRLSEIELAQCGLLEELGKLREIAPHPDFQTGLAATMKRKYSYYQNKKGIQDEVGVKRLQLAEILRRDTDDSKKYFFHRALSLGQKLLDISIPGYENTHSFQDIEWRRNTAMTFNEESNTTLNSIQLNYTQQGTAIADALKGKAHLHCDKDISFSRHGHQENRAYDGFGDYKGDTVFTELDSPRAFDTAVDTVPANPGWVPNSDRTMDQLRPFTTSFHDDVKYNGSGYWLHTIDAKLRGPKLAKLSSTIPPELDVGRQHTDEELNDIGYIRLEPGVCHFVAAPNAPDGKRFDHAYLSAVEIEKAGLLDRLVKVREKMLHRDFQPKLHTTMAKVRSRKFMEDRAKIYELGITVQKRTGRHSIQNGVILRDYADRDNRDLTVELTSIANALLETYAPGMKDEFRAKLNYLEIDEGMDGLRKFGQGHIDERDHPNMFTVLFFLGNPPPDYHVGNFALLGERTVCPTAPLSALVFSGKRWNAGIAPRRYDADTPASLRYVSPVQIPELPAGTPLMRLSVVAYPNRRMTDVHPQELGYELFTSAGSACFQSQKKYQEWRMSYYIAHERAMVALEALENREKLSEKAPKRKGNGRDRYVQLDTTGIVRHTLPSYFVNKFQWRDELTGQVMFPSTQLAIDTIAHIGHPNEEWDNLSKDMAHVSLGGKAPGKRKPSERKMLEAGTFEGSKRLKSNESANEMKSAEYQLEERVGMVEEEFYRWEEPLIEQDNGDGMDHQEPAWERFRIRDWESFEAP
ncbi:putative transcription factor c2h2 protein [Botrytis fragariae]|uniref:Putative transcription factor c2h2 protein n=1 Tax=Botrytis fragariae TaxID=1964551 RepID=A0A8H6EJU6_9HELO|nr:putative transcription factor c2h2 protein [Botrytis fragariae]KAF5874907.1 putative transcription factor c2h2 protein [Botrytis fragariae]